MAQKKANELLENTKDEKVAAQLVACVAQCGNAIGNLGLYIREHGDRKAGSDAPRQPTVLVQVNNNNARPEDELPPIANLPRPDTSPAT